MVVSKLDLCCLFPLCLQWSLLRIYYGVIPFCASAKLNKNDDPAKRLSENNLYQKAVQFKEDFILFAFLYLFNYLSSILAESKEYNFSKDKLQKLGLIRIVHNDKDGG